MTQAQFVENVQVLARQLKELRNQQPAAAGDESGNALEEARRRVAFLKHVIEDNDGYRLFYLDGNQDIILKDANSENKPSASKAKT